MLSFAISVLESEEGACPLSFRNVSRETFFGSARDAV